ncbi:MAG: alpha/beta hydrolase [Rhodocyclales bacterium]|nr:alpha/beta hydrolase [Rhodocyclales bacterium]
MRTWVFLRGLTRESRHWGDFPAAFRSAISGAAVVLLDLPGNGCLNGLTSPLGVAAMTDHCRAQLLAQDVGPPYGILAMSLGALVAVDWAARYPAELDACVLINTSLRPYSPFFRRLRPRNYPALLKLAVFGGSDRDWEETILRLTSRCAGPHTAILESWLAYRRERPVSRVNALRQLVAAGRYRAPQDRPSPRLLILAGARDALVDPSCSRRLAQQWRTAFAEHPDAGHDLPLDDGAWVVERIRTWLAAEPR